MKVYTFQTDNAAGDETLIPGKGGNVYKVVSINVINEDPATGFDISLILAQGSMETILERETVTANNSFITNIPYLIDPISQLKISCDAGLNITVIAEVLANG